MRYIYVGNKDLIDQITWGDIEETEGGIYLKNECRVDVVGSFYKFVGLILGNRIGCYSIYHKQAQLRNIKLTSGDLSLLMTEESSYMYPVKYLRWLRDKKRVKIVFVLLNPISVISKGAAERLDIADVIFSYDRTDCEKYGYEHFLTIFSMNTFNKLVDVKVDRDLYDVVYVGTINNRLEKIERIVDYFNEHCISANINIVASSTEDIPPKHYGINYPEYMSYEKIIALDKQSRCILEVLNADQHGVTRRTMEAIALRKKLITNNSEVVNMPFYDSKLIKVLDKDFVFDSEWLYEESDINYSYDGECGPQIICSKIAEILKNYEK